MRMLTPTLGLAGLLALAGGAGAGAGADPHSFDLQTLKAKAVLVKQDDTLLRWREIPWYTDAVEGIKAARSEKRPLLLWVTGDDPLGRC
jgi:hypothetical protein